MRFITIIGVLLVANLYVGLRINNHYFPTKLNIFWVVLVTLLLALTQSIGLLTRSPILLDIEQNFGLKGLELTVHQISYTLFGMLSCLFFYIAAIDFIKIILRLILSPSSLSYIYFNKFALPTVILITLSTVILGIIQVKNGPVVRKVEVFIKNLPSSFNGLKIAQISDLHVGSTIKHDYVTKVVNLTNSLEPNIIALTGDFIDGQVKYLKDDVVPLSHLRSTHGKFFVTGNHEYYWGAQAWIEEFTKLGIRVLSNEHVLIKQENNQIILAGVTDYSTIGKNSDNFSSPQKSLISAPTNLIKILLAHQPSSYIEAHKAGFDLQLSGHTHAGQYFPFTFLIRFFHRYYEGLNQHNGMWIFINRGTGYWGPPLRIGAPAEISLITLRSN